MRKNKRRNWLLLFAISCSLFYGCGYHLVGTGKNLPTHLRTISIPVFKNTSTQPEIHRELTSAILQSFISDGRLKVVKKEESYGQVLINIYKSGKTFKFINLQ